MKEKWSLLKLKLQKNQPLSPGRSALPLANKNTGAKIWWNCGIYDKSTKFATLIEIPTEQY